VELYLEIKKEHGSDFFFSCPNMNITSREYMKSEYMLTSLSIGANEKEYRWRAYKNKDFLTIKDINKVSGRIKLSDRKTIMSRMKRTYARHIGMYKIGYSTKQLIKEDIIERPWPLYSRLFMTAILPFVWFHSLFVETVCHAPVEGKTLPEVATEHTHKLSELKEKYNISKDLKIDEIIDNNQTNK
jgi:hypothetical protein